MNKCGNMTDRLTDNTDKKEENTHTLKNAV